MTHEMNARRQLLLHISPELCIRLQPNPAHTPAYSGGLRLLQQAVRSMFLHGHYHTPTPVESHIV
jgi:hypothetical protein